MYFLENMRDRVDKALYSVFDWYATREKGQKEYILKACIPLFVQRIAEDNLFRTHTFPPIVYPGRGSAKMVHLMFYFSSFKGNLQAFSDQSIADLIRLPMVRIEDGKLIVAPKQHPDFDFSVCSTCFEFLPDFPRNNLMESAS